MCESCEISMCFGPQGSRVNPDSLIGSGYAPKAGYAPNLSPLKLDKLNTKLRLEFQAEYWLQLDFQVW